MTVRLEKALRSPESRARRESRPTPVWTHRGGASAASPSNPANSEDLTMIRAPRWPSRSGSSRIRPTRSASGLFERRAAPCVLRADSGALSSPPSRLVRGAREVAGLAFSDLARSSRPALVNGAAGIVFAPEGSVLRLRRHDQVRQDRRFRHPRRPRAAGPARSRRPRRLTCSPNRWRHDEALPRDGHGGRLRSNVAQPRDSADGRSNAGLQAHATRRSDSWPGC